MSRRIVLVFATMALVVAVMGGASSGNATTMLARGGRTSGVAHLEARGTGARPGGPDTTCSTPGGTNYIANCHTTGRAVNETWIAGNGETYVAGANDYNSYNGQSDWGYYTSSDGKTWTDDGPLDLFAHDANNAAGDPGLAIAQDGTVFYSGIAFSYVDCNVGGVEIAKRDPVSGSWTVTQIRANSDLEFQDKPALAIDANRVFVSWTLYGSCDGIGVTSPIKVAVFNQGALSAASRRILSVPTSVYSQGSSIAADGSGGFWITWEEVSDPNDLTGEIRLSHWSPSAGWSTPRTISPVGFTDLPSPLPGFAFRNNSFPALALSGGKPGVVWTSYDTGVGRAYLYSRGSVRTVSDVGGDQFFPSIAPDGSNGFAVSWSQTNGADSSFDQYLSYLGTVTKVSTASSFPNSDPFFGGAFIGDYNGMVSVGQAPHPIWTDLRGPTFQQNAMVYSP